MIKIDKNIPFPDLKTSGRGAKEKYRFSLYEIGDSSFHEARQVQTAASSYGRNHNKQFKTIGVIENDIKGFRVWRIK